MTYFISSSYKIFIGFKYVEDDLFISSSIVNLTSNISTRLFQEKYIVIYEFLEKIKKSKNDGLYDDVGININLYSLLNQMEAYKNNIYSAYAYSENKDKVTRTYLKIA